MRVLHYSYGMYHLQQTLAIAEYIASNFPKITQLLVTGSPQPRYTKLPKRLDFIKLPNLDESSQEKYHAPSRLLPFDIVKSLREKITLEVIKYFKPDVVLMNTTETGKQKDIASSLNYLQQERPKTKLIFGVNDFKIESIYGLLGLEPQSFCLSQSLWMMPTDS